MPVQTILNAMNTLNPRPLKQNPSTGLLSNQGEKRYALLLHNGSFKKKVLKYGTPKPVQVPK